MRPVCRNGFHPFFPRMMAQIFSFQPAHLGRNPRYWISLFTFRGAEISCVADQKLSSGNPHHSMPGRSLSPPALAASIFIIFARSPLHIIIAGMSGFSIITTSTAQLKGFVISGLPALAHRLCTGQLGSSGIWFRRRFWQNLRQFYHLIITAIAVQLASTIFPPVPYYSGSVHNASKIPTCRMRLIMGDGFHPRGYYRFPGFGGSPRPDNTS